MKAKLSNRDPFEDEDDDFEEDDFKKKGRPRVPAPADPLLEKMKAYILDTYEPVQDPSEADVFMSTSEIFAATQRLYCNGALFNMNDLANWLHEKGFTFFDAGGMRFEWLLKTIR